MYMIWSPARGLTLQCDGKNNFALPHKTPPPLRKLKVVSSDLKTPRSCFLRPIAQRYQEVEIENRHR